MIKGEDRLLLYNVIKYMQVKAVVALMLKVIKSRFK